MTDEAKDLAVIIDSMIHQQKRVNEESNVGGPSSKGIDCIKDLMEIVDSEAPAFRNAQTIVDNWQQAQY